MSFIDDPAAWSARRKLRFADGRSNAMSVMETLELPRRKSEAKPIWIATAFRKPAVHAAVAKSPGRPFHDLLRRKRPTLSNRENQVPRNPYFGGARPVFNWTASTAAVCLHSFMEAIE
jgi:hypothetical protein